MQINSKLSDFEDHSEGYGTVRLSKRQSLSTTTTTTTTTVKHPIQVYVHPDDHSPSQHTHEKFYDHPNTINVKNSPVTIGS